MGDTQTKTVGTTLGQDMGSLTSGRWWKGKELGHSKSKYLPRGSARGTGR